MTRGRTLTLAWLAAVFAAAAAGAAAGCSKRALTLSQGSQPIVSIPAHSIARPSDAVASFAVLTNANVGEVGVHANHAALGLELRPELCGDTATCDAVHTMVMDRRALRIDVRPVTDWGMPGPDALAAMASGLTPTELTSLTKPGGLGTVVVVTARSATPADVHNAVAARAAWASAFLLAEALQGLVYDETVHRIENAATFKAHVMTEPLGSSVWREDRVRVQLNEQPDGTARLLTLGMHRFGAPDVEVEGAPMSDGRPLGAFVDLVAQKLVDGADFAPLRAAPDDGPPDVDLVAAPHHEGDPDNTVLRIVPAEDSKPDAAAGYDALVTRAFGKVDGVVATESPALTAIAARAQTALPSAIDRWGQERDAGASLLVKLPFLITGDAGAAEWMWVSVTDADSKTVTGTLANSPVYVADLRSGARVTGQRSDVADYLLDLGHGAKEGGGSIRALQKAASP